MLALGVLVAAYLLFLQPDEGVRRQIALVSQAEGLIGEGAYLEAMARLATGPIYLPLLLRPNQQAFSHRDLDALMRRLGIDGHAIEEDRVFQDFIVHGRKPGGTGR